MRAQPIATAPRNEEHRLLLYSPDRGWQSAVFHEGRWVDSATLTVVLDDATHWRPEPDDPNDGPPRLSVIRGGRDII